MIKLQNIEIGYNTSLFQIENLELHSGKVYAIFGPNGGGKSTFLKTVLGEIPPLSGRLLIKGREMENFKKIERSKLISFVASQFPGIDFLRVKEYLSLGRTPYLNYNGKLSSIDNNILSEVSDYLNIEPLLPEFTKDISDGERQICAIARSLITETPCILLDEPTAYLDYVNKLIVCEKLIRIAVEKNKLIIMSNHDLDLLLTLPIEILIIDKKNNLLRNLDASEKNKNEILKLCFDLP